VLMSDGSAAVTIRSVQASGAGFSVDGFTAPMTLNPGSNASMTLVFTPSAAQSASGSIVISSDAAQSSISIPVSGNGTTATKTLIPSVAQLNFGSVVVGGTNTSAVTLTNQGNASVTIRSVTGTGAGFSVSGFAAGTVVNPGQSTSFNVTFTPTVLGAASGQIVVSSDGSTLAIPLSGTAVQRSAHAVDLSWNQSEDVTGYNVYRQTANAGEFVKINPAVVANPAFEDDNVAPGMTYSYVVTSIASDGTESPESDSVSVEVPQN
jgi:Abnormal spindle-like microcephaly-assoc'd, ASPM-SPD-2-Hydin